MIKALSRNGNFTAQKGKKQTKSLETEATFALLSCSLAKKGPSLCSNPKILKARVKVEHKARPHRKNCVYGVDTGLIIKGTIPRVPPFSSIFPMNSMISMSIL